MTEMYVLIVAVVHSAVFRYSHSLLSRCYYLNKPKNIMFCEAVAHLWKSNKAEMKYQNHTDSHCKTDATCY